MKGNLEFLKKKVKKTSLHMKGRERLSKNEKYFDFPKMDKKMSKNDLPKKSLLTKFCSFAF